jgi:hypothetical protein
MATPEQAVTWAKAAYEQEKSLSAWLREAADEWAERERLETEEWIRELEQSGTSRRFRPI